MNLRKILKNIEILDTKNFIDFDVDIKKICYNSKFITESSLFVAIKGYITDGHKYILQAYEKGAVCAIVEDFIDCEIPQLKVENTRIELANVSKNFYDDPSQKLNIVGITATNGKTTTSFMLDKIYNDAGYRTGIIGTVYTKYSDITIPSVLTTPESLELQSFFRDMLKKKIEKVTMEVSSSSEELYRVKNIDFNIVAFNNFSREHIDQHGSFEKYYEAKSKLVKEASKNAVAILNMDFDHIKDLLTQTKARVITYSLENNDYDFSISELDLSTGFGKYIFNVNRNIDFNDFVLKKQSFEINLSVAGYSSVMNSVAAIIISLVQNIDVDIIKKSISAFSGVERRFEMIYDEKFKIIDDHYANVKNIDVTLETLSKMKYKNFRMLYAIRGNRGVNLNRETAEETAKWLKKLDAKTFYATLSKDTVSKKDEVSKEELEIFLNIMEKYNINVKVFDNLENSVYEILKTADKGDVVLFAGCQGMDKGAKFAYNYLKSNNLMKDENYLKNKINNRIC
ncbi:Mur ligase family protein [Peptoniphilus sp. oral taxon 386]|uniref:Mur ligase family protein n=1 Tax=Peptoniphilus sp. oral taxon 386 TaxID=652713 RepID=UPI0001DA9CD8|nr:Mur ligase family protein [Peptoniphilus sp. oral taxon 386]EFI42252.1 UDP-N-acetylmuramoyl-L-alanyl-D-glutamate--2,6-diaminopimelate ligase [Peptoniphilus sp. oral taxon 386 str. F0131]